MSGPSRLPRRVSRAACLAALGFATSLTGLACGAPELTLVEHRSVTLTLLTDGSLQVRETMRVRAPAEGAPLEEFHRTVSGSRVDSFFDTAVWLDGVPLDDDPNDAAYAVVDRDGDLEVRWHFPPAPAETVRELAFEYRAGGAMAMREVNGILEWPLVPIEPFVVATAMDLRLNLPRGVESIEPPRLVGAEHWDVSTDAGGLTARTDGVSADETVTLVVRVLARSMAAPRPEWQFDEAFAAELVPAWISGGLFMVTIGIGVVWMLRARYPDPSAADRAGPSATAPPAPVPPAFAAVLRRRRARRGRRAMEATIADLEARGVFATGAAADVRPLLAHEQVLVDEAWLSTGGSDGALAARLAGARRTYARALERDLVSAGLVDEERVTVARGLLGSGLTVVAMGAACAALIPWLLARFGVAIYAVPGGIVVLGLMLIVAGWRFVILTPAGERARSALAQ